jgi:hypothetical protein
MKSVKISIENLKIHVTSLLQIACFQEHYEIIISLHVDTIHCSGKTSMTEHVVALLRAYLLIGKD